MSDERANWSVDVCKILERLFGRQSFASIPMPAPKTAVDLIHRKNCQLKILSQNRETQKQLPLLFKNCLRLIIANSLTAIGAKPLWL